MQKAGVSIAAVGTLVGWVAVNMEPIGIVAGAIAICLIMVGLAMVLYQSYLDDEAAEMERRRKKLFRTWAKETDLRKG